MSPARLAILLALALFGCSGGPAPSAAEPEPAAAGPDPLSDEVMRRDAETNVANVKHILVPASDKDLALKLLQRVRAGEPIEPLMAEFSTDAGSAKDGQAYEVRPDAQLVFEFKRAGLRLKVGEAAMVKSQFGWHVMKRIE
jgi:hypothetical protein